jgi:hypothetical protein
VLSQSPGRSALSAGSLLSLASAGSILSVGSAGSILSFGSTGSILSIGSVGSVLSVGSIGSLLSVRSYCSILSKDQSFAIRKDGRPARSKRPKDAPTLRVVSTLVLLATCLGHGR